MEAVIILGSQSSYGHHGVLILHQALESVIMAEQFRDREMLALDPWILVDVRKPQYNSPDLACRLHISKDGQTAIRRRDDDAGIGRARDRPSRREEPAREERVEGLHMLVGSYHGRSRN